VARARMHGGAAHPGLKRPSLYWAPPNHEVARFHTPPCLVLAINALVRPDLDSRSLESVGHAPR
jgi:hypothetical protein